MDLATAKEIPHAAVVVTESSSTRRLSSAMKLTERSTLLVMVCVLSVMRDTAFVVPLTALNEHPVLVEEGQFCGEPTMTCWPELILGPSFETTLHLDQSKLLLRTSNSSVRDDSSSWTAARARLAGEPGLAPFRASNRATAIPVEVSGGTFSSA